MLFNSWEFIGLFVITALLYFTFSIKYRMPVLLISSYFFYIYWRWDFTIIMLFITIVNYISGIEISKTQNMVKKRGWLFFTLTISLIPLIYFKYGNFLIENTNHLLSIGAFEKKFSYLDVILPVGISFFTFQALSYSLDVFYGNTRVEKNLVRFGTFVSFFPQLVAGPIERSSNLLNQLKKEHFFSFDNLITGSKMFIWGLFKKIVIADRLALYVDKIYEVPSEHSGSTLTIATFFFAFQIYCDFSGYSDMAIGTARILGFKLMQNFNLPYLAASISDFWKRWHISLSSWFGDYLYKPLGGSRVTYIKWLRNILAVFLISGLWHGASWTFIVWGLLHAFYYFFENWGDKLLNLMGISNIKNIRFYKIFKITLVFTLTCYAWIYFRAGSLTDAFLISERIFGDWGKPFSFGSSRLRFFLSLGLIMLLFSVQILQYKGISSLYFSKSKVNPILVSCWYLFLLFSISLLGIASNSFIYFQF